MQTDVGLIPRVKNVLESYTFLAFGKWVKIRLSRSGYDTFHAGVYRPIKPQYYCLLYYG